MGLTLGPANAQKIVLKTADETVNNSSALQDDDELFFQIGVNEKWFVECILLLSASSGTADWKLGLAGPTGATGTFQAYTTNAWVTVTSAGTPANPTALGSSFVIGGVSGQQLAHVAGWVTADATHAGTVKFQWAQNTATVEDNKVLASSFLRIRRLA